MSPSKSELGFRMGYYMYLKWDVRGSLNVGEFSYWINQTV